MERTLRTGFLASATRFPARPALEIGGQSLTYAELERQAMAIAAALTCAGPAEGTPLTAVLGHRTPAAFAAILGALLRGHGYVPLNPAFPVERNVRMLQRAGCPALVVDETAQGALPEVLARIEHDLVVLLPAADPSAIAELRAKWPRHRLLGAADLADAPACEPAPVRPDDIAYLLFTSGSTGDPKGVMVAHRNVAPFIDAMVERYGITEHDRFSQTFDLTFDLSVFDMFVAWERGACVCVPTQAQKALPGKYVVDSELTVWFSVPSTAALMSRLRLLKPGRYPRLRWSLFCGEALPAELAERWLEAAPGSTLENLYGPTELTIACTLYRWDTARSRGECEQGIVPIGEPYPGMQVLVADEVLREVGPGETGELLMTGPQLTLGYWQDPARTGQAFVIPPDRDEIYYRTGDRVRRPRQPREPLIYLGRVDNQIKIQGYRVELGEIEAALREVAGVETAIAVGWPINAGGADGIVGFVGDADADVAAVRRLVADRLPGYMQPSEVVAVGEFPLNANGKVDRKALLQRLAERAG